MAEIHNSVDIDKITLTELIDVETLQKMQDSFSKMARMAALTTDENGIPVTNGSNFSEFCTNFCRKSEIGRKRCEECDRMGAVRVKETGEPSYYYCHANLVDFAAPIMLGDRMLGSFIGGQVLAEAPDYDKMRQIAKEIEVDEEEFIKAAEKTDVIPLAAIERATRFLYEFTSTLSDMAYQRYVSMELSEAAMQAANMKSDFLANMSHEIRTPMNAIVGMAHLALREPMSPVVAKYLNQIISSSKILLTVINDVLDFSKIESGKLTITMSEYDPMELVNDVATIIMNRIGDKSVDLILNIDPNIPKVLYGDDIRIKQIIVNLANNAVKFTNSGKVELKLEFEQIDDEQILLACAVKDTGVGIKEEDFDKLFDSFMQLDSKRNRGVEGTGLGLAITKNLLELMGGKIKVNSVYGKGSEFTIMLPQSVRDNTPSIVLADKNKSVGALISNANIKKQLTKDIERLGLELIPIETCDDVCKLYAEGKEIFLFAEQVLITEQMEELLNESDIITVFIMGEKEKLECDIKNALALRFPIHVSSIATVLEQKDVNLIFSNSNDESISFIAPNAEILIVDDNEVNLTVAAGLLEPLQMKIDLATSGKEAIEKVTNKRYDIVFMDHMMPEIDGVETTRIIRRFHPELDDMPIIALTANAIRETQCMFIEEGMNDFVAKPIDFKVIVSKIKEWLPPEKIKTSFVTEAVMADEEELGITLEVADLDTAYALNLLGSEKLFWAVLRDYYHIINKKAELIKMYEENEQIKEYTVEVHSLKSSSRQIGAMSLAKKAEALEDAGNKQDIEMIHEMTDDMLKVYKRYASLFAPYFEEEKLDTASRARITEEELSGLFERMREALENLDMDDAENVVKDMMKYSYDEPYAQLLEELETAVDNMDVEECEVILEKWNNV